MILKRTAELIVLIVLSGTVGCTILPTRDQAESNWEDSFREHISQVYEGSNYAWFVHRVKIEPLWFHDGIYGGFIASYQLLLPIKESYSMHRGEIIKCLYFFDEGYAMTNRMEMARWQNTLTEDNDYGFIFFDEYNSTSSEQPIYFMVGTPSGDAMMKYLKDIGWLDAKRIPQPK